MTDDDKETAKVFRKVEMLRVTNAGIVREIESYGGGVDLATARVEAMMEFLVSAGVLTRRQQADEQLIWEMGLKQQLIGVRDGLIKLRSQQGLRPSRAERRRGQGLLKGPDSLT